MNANLNVIARLLLKLISQEEWPRAVAIAYRLGAMNERTRDSDCDQLRVDRAWLKRFEKLAMREARIRWRLTEVDELRRQATR